MLKLLKYALFCTLLTLAGCVYDDGVSCTDPVEVDLLLSLTRASADISEETEEVGNEYYIDLDDVEVLAYQAQADGTDYTLRERAMSVAVTPVSGSYNLYKLTCTFVSFTEQELTDGVSVKISIYANMDGGWAVDFPAGTASIPSSESALNSALTFSYTGGQDTQTYAGYVLNGTNDARIPMWGCKVMTLSRSSSASDNTIEMLRALAKVEVRPAAGTSIEITSVTLQNAAGKGTVTPGDAHTQTATERTMEEDTDLADKINIPSDVTYSVSCPFVGTTGGAYVIYLPEQKEYDSTSGSGPYMDVVIGGISYPLYFGDYTYTDSKNVIDPFPVLRNYWYTFEILSTTSVDRTLEWQVCKWEKRTGDITFN